MRLFDRAGIGFVLLLIVRSVAAGQWITEETDKGVTVKLDGQLVSEYLIRSGAKPILWPLIGPAGQPLTRSYPLADVPGEEQDHIHQRSCWFTHGKVNGIDFWGELPNHGNIVHQKFDLVEGGERARIHTQNHWIGPDGRKFCEDERHVTFQVDDDRRFIDFDVTVRAAEAPVTFSDTKEGSFGVRMASSIRVDSKQGGEIVNSRGDKDQAAWGKAAEWVDYHGPVPKEGGGTQKAGIAILNHPSSFRFPTYWHVRTYGLFAANPFGVHDFTNMGDGSVTLEPGQSFTLRYRLVLHAGDEKEGKIAEAYEAYAKER